MNTREKGRDGEDAAADYLTTNGFTIEARNYQTKNGEIDIIANAPDGTLVFVEVKAANSPAFGNPLFRITPSKRRSIVNTAKRYMFERGITNRACRVDVISIYKGKIDHIPNAFFA